MKRSLSEMLTGAAITPQEMLRMQGRTPAPPRAVGQMMEPNQSYLRQQSGAAITPQELLRMQQSGAAITPQEREFVINNFMSNGLKPVPMPTMRTFPMAYGMRGMY